MNNKKHQSLIAFLPFLALVLFMAVTDPHNLPLGLLILPVILLFLGFYKITRLLLSIINKSLPNGTNRLVGLVVATIPALLLIMQSIRELTLRDVLLLLVTGVLLTTYVIKLRPTF